MIPRGQLSLVTHENWPDSSDADDDTLRSQEDNTRVSLPGIIPRALGDEAASHAAELELVTAAHSPQPGVRRAATLRKPRKPRTARDKMAADQPPEHQRVTPQGHDPHITVHDGERTNR